MTSEPTAPHILLVDDDEDFLYQHKVQLEHAGYRVTTATTRAEAEALAADLKPDLAILDLMMEQHDDGFVLSHHLKRLLPGLPVILVTAVTAETGLSFAPTSGAERAWVGADAMLAKPIRFEQLKREVERLLRDRDKGLRGSGLGAGQHAERCKGIAVETLRVLVVDDETGMRLAVARVLNTYTVRPDESEEHAVGFTVETAESGEAALEMMAASAPDILLLDMKLGGMSGLDVLRELRERRIETLTVMITAYATIETAIEATKRGAHDFLPKPFTPEDLRVAIRRVVRHLAVQREARRLAEEKRQVRFQFISVLGHELKAPLAAVEGYLQIMKDGSAGSDPAVVARIIDRALVRTEGMRKLIVDLLNMTRIESGRKRRDLVAADLRDAATAAMETVAQRQPPGASPSASRRRSGRRSSPIAASSTSSSTTSSAMP